MSRRVAVMVAGRAVLVPKGQTPEQFAAAQGWKLVDAAQRPSVAMSDKPKRDGITDVQAMVEANLKAGVRNGTLITARSASSRLGGTVLADAIARKAITVNVINGRRYVSREAVDALAATPEARRSAAAPTPTAAPAPVPTRNRRPRRPPPSWAK